MPLLPMEPLIPEAPVIARLPTLNRTRQSFVKAFALMHTIFFEKSIQLRQNVRQLQNWWREVTSASFCCNAFQSIMCKHMGKRYSAKVLVSSRLPMEPDCPKAPKLPVTPVFPSRHVLPTEHTSDPSVQMFFASSKQVVLAQSCTTCSFKAYMEWHGMQGRSLKTYGLAKDIQQHGGKYLERCA